MDEKSLNLTAESILHKVFKKNVKGYDPDEVDQFLDLVIADYQAYDEYAKEVQNYIQSLETKLKKMQDEARERSVDLAKAQARLQGVSSDKDRTLDIQTVQYIDRLERACYQKGIDPRTLK
ncbi:MAG: DivIVA domain-containing protein [Candidatus Enteromonas sp.]